MGTLPQILILMSIIINGNPTFYYVGTLGPLGIQGSRLFAIFYLIPTPLRDFVLGSPGLCG